jgi:TolA-binding protein
LIEAFPFSSEAASAGFLLGEHDRMLDKFDVAFRSFAQVFDNLRHNDRYASLWMPKEMIVERCVEMIRDDIEKQRHAEAIKLLEMLGGVMRPAEIARLCGETYESWAELLQSQAAVTFGEQGNLMSKEAESKWRDAGTAFATLAQLVADTLDGTAFLWRGAENYRLGKDYRRAAMEYKKFLLTTMKERRPEVHLRLGEMYLNLDVLDEAVFLLKEALQEYPTHPLVPQIRLVLSYVFYEQKAWEKAKDLLKLNLIGEASPTSGPYRDSMYALGEICFAQGDLDSASLYLEDAIKIHPDALQAAEGNYTLAQTHLRLAEKQLEVLTENPSESVRREIESIVRTHRHQALSYLRQTESLLADRLRTVSLTGAERLMLRNVHFAVCTLLLQIEEYDQAIARLSTVATMYQDQPEVLDALFQMVFALRITGKDTQAQMTLRRAEVILNQLEKTGKVTNGAEWRSRFQGLSQ